MFMHAVLRKYLITMAFNNIYILLQIQRINKHLFVALTFGNLSTKERIKCIISSLADSYPAEIKSTRS